MKKSITLFNKCSTLHITTKYTLKELLKVRVVQLLMNINEIILMQFLKKLS